MANGTAVRLPPVTVESTSAKPATASATTAIQIGIAMADATEALAASMADYDAGELTAANRARGGETVAALVELQLAATVPDFGALALTEGRRVLRARHSAALHQLGSDARIDDVFGELLSHILAVANKVAAIEAVYRAH